MRESLTILAMALIVVLTTALVGPYFVDWNSHRGQIETRLSTLLGAKVTVGGPIDVKLLPRPIFRLQEVTVAGRLPGDPTASAARLDVELALTALLRGDFVFVDADLTQPRLTLVMSPAGAVELPRFQATDPEHVTLSHVAVHQGTVAVVDTAGRPVLTASGLSGDGEAESLSGPFRFNGTLDTARGALPFRVNTGTLEGGRMRLKASADAQGSLPRTDVEGMMTLNGGPQGAVIPVFDGSLTAGAALPVAGSKSTVPWSIAARLAVDTAKVEVNSLELRAGADGRAMIATGAGRVEFGAQPKAAFVLRARQADLPRLLVAPGEATDNADPAAAGAASATAALAALRGLLADPDALSGLPLPVAVDYAVDAVTLGQMTLTALNGRLALAPDAAPSGTLAVSAPDGSHLAFDGTFEPGAAAVFKGRLEATSHDVGHLADSLSADLPDAADALRNAVPAHDVSFAGTVDLSAIGFAARDIALALDRSRFAGTLTLTRTVGQERARLFADLTSDALDLDALSDWRDTASAAADLDLDLSLSARAVRLAESDTGGVSTGRVGLQLTKAGSAITLERLAIADIGGATADFSGRSDGSAAHIEGRLDAARLRDLLALVHKLLPDTATDALLARADALSPALLNVSADAALDDTNNPRLTKLSLDGTAAGTALELHLAPAPPAAFSATMRLDAPEAGALLRQLGIATTPSTAIGRGHIEADAHLDDGFAPRDGGLKATLADTVLTLRGRRGDGAALAGQMTLKGGNVAPLLRAVQLAAPEPGATWPADAAADLAWGNGRLAVAGLAGQAMGVGFRGDLVYAAPVVDTAPIATTSLTEAPAAAPPALTGTLSIDRLPLSVLAALSLGPLPPPKPGALWPDAPFAAGFLTLPRTAIALKVTSLPLTATATGHEAAMDLQLGAGVVGLTGFSAKLGDGRLAGTLALRRNGNAASLGGHVAWDGLDVASPSLGGRSRGALDLAGTGTSLAGLVASLAGGGTLGLDEGRLPRLDAAALGKAVLASGATSEIDSDAIKQAVAKDLDHGALALGSVSTPVTLAAGVLRADPLVVEGPVDRSTTVGTLDLRSLALSLTTTVTLRAVPKDWVGSPPTLTVSWKGPFAAPTREVDAASLVNGIAARAIALDQARIQAFQDDIRERSFFASRLRQIEAEQQAKAAADQKAAMDKLLQSLPGTSRPSAGGPQKPPVDLTPNLAPNLAPKAGAPTP